MTIEHEFTVSTGRCRYCGTQQARHEANPAGNPCVPRWESGEKPMPEPARREYASEDFGAIGTRVAELLAEQDAVLQRETESD